MDENIIVLKIKKYFWNIIFILYSLFFMDKSYSYITKFIVITLWSILYIISIQKLILHKKVNHWI